MVKLVQPTLQWETEILSYKAEMIANGDESLSGCGGLHRTDDIEQWLKHLNEYKDRHTIDPKSNYVEGSQWLLVDTAKERILGMVNIRHYLNDFLLQYGGHIGYSIRPSERRKGYATKQLQLALDLLKSKGEERALVTCDVNNIASAKTIESCHGVLEDIRLSKEHGQVKRYWIQL